MDSSSSGSLQSSSGGGGGIGTGGGGGSHEEEYTSNANHEILSPFLPLINNSSSTQYHQYPFPNSLDHAFPLNPNPSLPRSSLDSPWLAPSSTQLVPHSCTDNDTTQLLNPVTSASMMHLPVQSENNNRPTTATTSGCAMAAQRGAKKRSRASRRPPTTVLTTDTSNFRAMVQEFTGFPAAPFVPSSPFVRPRLGSGLGLFQSGGSNTGLNSPYLLRPFPQKLQTNNPAITPGNLSSSTIVDAIASIARNSNLANNLNSMFGTSNANANATSTSSSGSNTNFVNASSSAPSAVATNNNNSSATDPISSFANLHSHQATNSNKYSFAAQAAAGDLDGLVGSNGGSNNPMRLACDQYERDKSSRFVNSEFDTAQAIEKGVFGFLNYADLKDKR